jgi:hypothetical protein
MTTRSPGVQRTIAWVLPLLVAACTAPIPAGSPPVAQRVSLADLVQEDGTVAIARDESSGPFEVTIDRDTTIRSLTVGRAGAGAAPSRLPAR